MKSCSVYFLAIPYSLPIHPTTRPQSGYFLFKFSHRVNHTRRSSRHTTKQQSSTQVRRLPVIPINRHSRNTTRPHSFGRWHHSGTHPVADTPAGCCTLDAVITLDTIVRRLTIGLTVTLADPLCSLSLDHSARLPALTLLRTTHEERAGPYDVSRRS